MFTDKMIDTTHQCDKLSGRRVITLCMDHIDAQGGNAVAMRRNDERRNN